jgi:L-fuconolactonase
MNPFPIVDAHLHVWDINRLRYPWLESVPLLNRSYLLDDYRQACGEIQIEKMVFVQAECDFSQYHQEAQWVTELAQQDNRIAGIVAWAPLEEGEPVRDELESLAANPLIRGIRRIIQFEEDIEFCLRPDFIKGVQSLADYALSFDICIAHHQMANALSMVRQCHEVRFILDHIGKPDIKNQLFEPWKTEIKALAEIPNLWCKMSGLVTEADMENWTPDDLKPFIEHVLDCFGFDRVAYGGDWPVARQATEYPRWVETLYRTVEQASQSEKQKLFRDNAVKFYNLDTNHS